MCFLLQTNAMQLHQSHGELGQDALLLPSHLLLHNDHEQQRLCSSLLGMFTLMLQASHPWVWPTSAQEQCLLGGSVRR